MTSKSTIYVYCITIFLVIFSVRSYSQQISGKIKELKMAHKLFLSKNNSLNEFKFISVDQIVKRIDIDVNNEFSISSSYLTDDYAFYRIYFVPNMEANLHLANAPKNRNYFYTYLNKNSTLTFNIKSTDSLLYNTNIISNDTINYQIINFEKKYYELFIEYYECNTNTKESEHLKQNLDNFVEEYFENCKNVMLKYFIYATFEINEEIPHKKLELLYKEMKKEYPNSIYTVDLKNEISQRKILSNMNYYTVFRSLTIILAITNLISLALLFLYRKEKKSIDNSSSQNLSILTKQEIKIFELLIEGKSNKEIAEVNFIEVSTVKTHISNIYRKLNVENRKDLIKISNN